jgi:hypothetical protein
LLRPQLRVTWVPATVASATFAQGLNGYTGTEDTQVRIASPDTGYPTNTTLSPDWITTGSTYLPNQVLLKFKDIVGTGAGQVPPGSTIFAAVLELTSINADAEGDGATFNRALKSWTTNDTWNTLVDGMSADDVEAVAAATAMLPLPGFSSNVKPTKWVIELTQDMQAWVNGAPNNGWVLFPRTNGSNGWAFNSAEATVPPNTQPQLRVYYEPGVILGMPIYNGTGSLQLPFTGVASRTYSVWRAGAINGTWTKLGTQTTSGAGAATYTDNSPLAGSAFYRVSYP